jgi:hypothetical protein
VGFGGDGNGREGSGRQRWPWRVAGGLGCVGGGREEETLGRRVAVLSSLEHYFYSVSFESTPALKPRAFPPRRALPKGNVIEGDAIDFPS